MKTNKNMEKINEKRAQGGGARKWRCSLLISGGALINDRDAHSPTKSVSSANLIDQESVTLKSMGER